MEALEGQAHPRRVLTTGAGELGRDNTFRDATRAVLADPSLPL